MSVFTEEELAGLSDEERAALEDVDDTGDEELEAAEAEGDAEQAGPQEEASEELEVSAEAEGGEQDETTAEEPEPIDPGQFVPRFQAEDLSDLSTKMAEINEAKRALGQQYQDGDIDWSEFETKRDELDEKALDLREAKSQSDMMAKLAAQTEAQHWQWEQDRFFAQKANAVYKDDELAYVALDHTIKRLAADEANNGKPMAWFIEEADRQVRSRFYPKQEPVVETKAKAAQKTRPKMPPNLGDMPPADLQDTGNPDEFAKLDKLSGMDLEKAISKLTPEQQERYLMG